MLPSGTDFKNNLKVDIIQTNKQNKIMLGFYMQSQDSFGRIKFDIGFKWLQEHNIFICPQSIAFYHGLTSISLAIKFTAI